MVNTGTWENTSKKMMVENSKNYEIVSKKKPRDLTKHTFLENNKNHNFGKLKIYLKSRVKKCKKKVENCNICGKNCSREICKVAIFPKFVT